MRICAQVVAFVSWHALTRHLIWSKKIVDGEMDRFSEVDKNLCMGCGICVAACPLGAISRDGVANIDIRPQIQINDYQNEPKLITFICDWSLREAEDVSILESYPTECTYCSHSMFRPY